jgi:hypothetical protein
LEECKTVRPCTSGELPIYYKCKATQRKKRRIAYEKSVISKANFRLYIDELYGDGCYPDYGKIHGYTQSTYEESTDEETPSMDRYTRGGHSYSRGFNRK